MNIRCCYCNLDIGLVGRTFPPGCVCLHIHMPSECSYLQNLMLSMGKVVSSALWVLCDSRGTTDIS